MIDVHSADFERVFLSSPLIIEKTGGDIFISGVALSVGTWKDVFYTPEELKKVADKLKGIPVKINHQQDTHVGEVVSSEWNDLVKAILFRAKIDKDFPIAEWDAVSCGTWMKKIEENGRTVGHDFNIDELSLTNTPADPLAIIITKEQLSSAIKPDQGVNKMSEKKEENPKLFAIVELSNMDEVEELKKKYPYVHPYYGYANVKPFYYKDEASGEYYPYYPYYKDKYPNYPYKGYPYYPKEKVADIICPIEGDKFATFEEFQKHWADKHVEKYGEYAPKEQKTAEILSAEPAKEVPKEDPVKKENEDLKKEVENLKKSVQLSLDATKTAEASKEQAVKDAVQETKTKILTDFEDVHSRASECVSQWKGGGPKRLVEEIHSTINKYDPKYKLKKKEQ
jgi:hypothetical protein